VKRTIIALCVLTIGSGALIALAHHGPDTVTIDAAADKKSPVVFPHAAHIEVVDQCDTCHHTQEGLTAESDAEVETCASCHLDPESEDVPSMRQMSLKKNPFHAGCIDCHKEEGAGPTKCDECHPKE